MDCLPKKENCICFDLPLWTGTSPEKSEANILPFSLNLNPMGFVQQNTERAIIDQVIENYSCDDYGFITTPPGLSSWSTRLGNSYFDFIDSYLPQGNHKKFLEIGAGSDFLANQLADRYCFDSYDIYDPAIVRTRLNPKIVTNKCYFSSELMLTQRYDYAISLNTLEHVPSPFDFLKAVHLALKEDGVFFLVFPDIEKQFLAGDLNSLLHEHLNYFTPSTADYLIQTAKFEIQIKYSTADTLFYVLRKKSESQIVPLPNQGEFLDQSYQAFNQTISNVRNTLNLILPGNEGNIAFHGATNGLNNISSLLGLNNNKNWGLFDSDESKSDRYISALEVKIKHSLDDAYKKYKYVFVSTLTYYDEIKKFLVETYKLDEKNIFLLSERLAA